MPLRPGTRLGPYEVLDLIGAGGMGEVYRARDTRLDRTVAIKVIPTQFAGRPDQRARFEREARAISALSHPRICTLHDVGEHEGTPFLVMEYLTGETLAAPLRKGPLPISRALQVATEIAEGLAAAHKQGIVHRDLKPSNVMLTKTGVKILDFGIAKITELDRGTPPAPAATTTAPLTGEGAILGTRPYMAPEQVEGKPADARTDLWALGTILYEMLTGRRAFAGETAAGLTVAILEREPEPLVSVRPETPPALERLVRRCLAKDPEARWYAAHDLADELAWIAQGSGSGAAVVIPGSRLRRQRWTRRARFASLLLVAGLAGALLARWGTVLGGGRPLAVPDRDHSSVSAAGPLVAKPRQLTSAPGWETSPAISPDSSLIAYVSDESGNPDLWIVGVGGTDALQLTDDSAVEDKPFWYPDGRTLAFASDRDGAKAIWRVPVLGGNPTLLVPDASDPAIDPAGGRVAFVRVGSNGLSRVAVVGLREPGPATVLTQDEDGVWNHRDPVWSPDGQTIVYAAQRGLWTVPASGGDAKPLTMDDEADEEPAWSGDGRYVYFSSFREGTQALWRVASSGGPPQRVTLGTGPESHPSLSRSGRDLVFTTFTSTPDVVVRDLATGREVALPNVRSAFVPQFSHDARTLMFVSDRAGGEFRIWQQPITGGRPSGPAKVLTDHHASTPTYSPDGRWVAYYRVGGGQPRNIWIIPSTGGASTRLTDSSDQEWHPAWSPRGTDIAFVSERNGISRILAAPVRDGRPAGPARALTSVPGQYQAPAWSPDGGSLAYIEVNAARASDVWITRADGTQPPRQVTASGQIMRVRWHPRGQALLVSALEGENIVILQVDRAGGPLRPIDPAVRMGTNPTLADFDVSRDGRWLAFSRDAPVGDVWTVEVKDS